MDAGDDWTAVRARYEGRPSRIDYRPSFVIAFSGPKRPQRGKTGDSPFFDSVASHVRE